MVKTVVNRPDFTTPPLPQCVPVMVVLSRLKNNYGKKQVWFVPWETHLVLMIKRQGGKNKKIITTEPISGWMSIVHVISIEAMQAHDMANCVGDFFILLLTSSSLLCSSMYALVPFFPNFLLSQHLASGPFWRISHEWLVSHKPNGPSWCDRRSETGIIPKSRFSSQRMPIPLKSAIMVLGLRWHTSQLGLYNPQQHSPYHFCQSCLDPK